MKSIKWSAVVACALLASVASAQNDDEPIDRPMDNRPRQLEDRVGLGLTIGGGAQAFIDKDVTDVTGTGGNWDARLIIGTRNVIAGEVAYLGTAQALDALGLEDSATLVSNGIEGAFRVNFLRGDWQPYALVGYTWRRYSVTNSEVNTSSVRENANVSEIPVAAGLSYRFRGFLADARFGLHNAFGNSLIPNTNLSSFSGEAKVGFEF